MSKEEALVDVSYLGQQLQKVMQQAKDAGCTLDEIAEALGMPV